MRDLHVNSPARAQAGFSMVEAMVTLAVLTALVAIAAPNYRKMEARAHAQATMNMLLGIRAIVMGVRPVEKKTLPEMSLDACLFCAQGFVPPFDMHNYTPGWDASIKHDWEVFGYSEQPWDTWGRAIIADANEMEYNDNDCRHDAVWSAGENAIWDGVCGGGYGACGDDLVVAMPFYKQTAARCPDNFF